MKQVTSNNAKRRNESILDEKRFIKLIDTFLANVRKIFKPKVMLLLFVLVFFIGNYLQYPSAVFVGDIKKLEISRITHNLKDGIHDSSEYTTKFADNEAYLARFLSIWQNQLFVFSPFEGQEGKVLNSEMVDYLVVIHYEDGQIGSMVLYDRHYIDIRISNQEMWLGLFKGKAFYYQQVAALFETIH